MEQAELVKTASLLVQGFASGYDGDLTCGEPGHPGGHTCLPITADHDTRDLVETFGVRFPDPYTRAHGLPPLPLDDRYHWTHSWTWGARAIALGRGPDGRPVLAVTERNMPEPDDLPAGMPWIERLVAISGPATSPPPAPDWAAVEARLGTPLPGDYKRLVETYGCDGTFDVFFQVFDPDELISYWEYFAGDEPAAGDLPGWPVPGGLIPWSNNEHHETFWWIAEGPDPDRWPVYAVTEDDQGERFDCTATEFLFRQMTDPEWPFYSSADHLTGHWFMKFRRDL
ncbi:SMI1/KNR4 family protein [Spirillospora sp. NPDC052242]